MGKYSLLITVGVVAAVSVLSLQGEQISQDTSERQARRSGAVLARQVARSGYNAVLSKARLAEQEYEDVEDIVDAVGTVSGRYEGGTYEAELKKVSPTAYKAVSIGRFPIADRVMEHKIGEGYEKNVADPPEVTEPSSLKLEYSGSGRSGYCSAVYLKRRIPDVPEEEQPEPEILYPPSDDERSPAIYDKTVQPGTKLNFILAVYEKESSWDDNCGGREGEEVSLDAGYYDQTYRSFERNADAELSGLQETSRSIVEEDNSEGEAQKWRVAFEGYEVFSEEQLWDIKENGYPTDVRSRRLPQIWEREGTYGGDGWEKNSDGLYELDEGYQYRPDFNDEVFEATTMEPPTS